MSAYAYDETIGAFARGELDWEQDLFKVMLVTDEYQPEQAQDATTSDLRAFEVPETGTYVRGGAVLPGRFVTRGETGSTRLDAGNVDFENMTAEFRYAIVYHAKTGRLVSYTDFRRSQVVDNARVLLEYGRDGGVVELIAVAA